jgi:hypothetical protein
MPRHITTLGFIVTTEQDFRHYVYQTTEFGEKIETRNGSYTYWSPGQGIELWAQTNLHRRLLGMNAHFRGETSIRVQVTGRIPRYGSSILDGAFYSWASPEQGDKNAGLFPFVFDSPDYDVYDWLPIPCVAHVQLAAFAYYLRCFSSEQQFRSSRYAGKPSMPLAFAPSGLFTPDGKVRRPALAEATFSGRVLAAEMVTNPVTWQKFYRARVQTLIGELDVVADPQVIQGTLVNGGMIHGEFWLSGRLVDTME